MTMAAFLGASYRCGSLATFNRPVAQMISFPQKNKPVMHANMNIANILVLAILQPNLLSTDSYLWYLPGEGQICKQMSNRNIMKSLINFHFNYIYFAGGYAGITPVLQNNLTAVLSAPERVFSVQRGRNHSGNV